MAYIEKHRVNGHTYYRLVEKRNGKRVVLKHLGNEEAYQKYLQRKEKAWAIVNDTDARPATPDMPDGKFDVIYADAPWRYDFDVESRATEKHYPTLLVKDICKLKDTHKVKIQEKFAENAILFLWATAPKLNEAFQVITAWGFTYKTNMVWVKDKIGLGWYCRNQHELLLIAVKGEMPLPDAPARPPSVLELPRTTHSTKPKKYYDLIEQMYPGRKYLEVFGLDNQRPNWTVFGNNVYE